MKRIRKRWRYIGWGTLAVAVFFAVLTIMELWARL
jgi:hypothetical protein